jgi:hypothetical protein
MLAAVRKSSITCSLVCRPQDRAEPCKPSRQRCWKLFARSTKKLTFFCIQDIDKSGHDVVLAARTCVHADVAVYKTEQIHASRVGRDTDSRSQTRKPPVSSLYR